MEHATTASSRRPFVIRLGDAAPIWLYIAGLCAAGLGLWLGAVRHLGPAPGAEAGVPWWGFALVFFLTEAYVVHVHFRREAHTISLNEIALVPALYLLAPGPLLLANLAGAGAALVFHRRQRPVKLAFNLAQFALTTSAALLVFRAVAAAGHPFGPAGWAAALLATVTASMFGIALVTGAIAIAQRELAVRQLGTTALISFVATIATASLALVAVELGRYDARALVLLVVPGAIVAHGFHSFVKQHRKHEHLEFLYQSMKSTQGAAEFSLAIGQLLIAVRHLARAEYAEIFLFPTAGEPGLRSSLDAAGEMVSHADVAVTADEEILAEVGAMNNLLILPAHRPPGAADGYLGSRNLPDAMITTLRGEGGPFGLLVVGDRAGDTDSFREEDGRLLETFSDHASVLLENGRLERTLADVTELQEQLRHQAFHDALTGLPNRTLLVEHVSEAMARPEDGDRAAVLFLDLDDFKAINDSRGHSVGDQLLVHVAERVRASVRPGDMPARLGGDEFAVLLPGTTRDGAEVAAQRIITAFSKPFDLEGRETYVHSSVGIALADSALSADELLRNADVAMYAAKAEGKKRLAHYDPSMYAQVRRRHDFALDLEHAVERDEITVVYQPIVSLRSGDVLAFEALARWNHPEEGVIQPGEFIPLAEASGLMEDIGETVLRQACRTASEWQAAHPDFGSIGVSVNLSPGQLSSERLVSVVACTLLEHRLDPDTLTLEVTESTAMRDIELATTRLIELRALGVRLALDDFGTGHSSLDRLDTLPLSLIKIPKPFIDRLLDRGSETSFVDVFVRLAHSIGLECVAEGIEHEIQVPRLLDCGCGLGQGFHFARPMDGSDVLAYLGSAGGIRSRA